ncbi:MAG: hypothetical protein OEU54_11980 [Gemmatimonadota bacterium]|nr:hypothetical protein [Gemmatimonadota bacterium]
MDMEYIAPMLAIMTIVLTAGGVLVLRPITKRLGDLLELRTRQARGEIENPRDEHTDRLLESIDARLSLMEERLDFTDQLLRTKREPRELPTSSKETWE